MPIPAEFLADANQLPAEIRSILDAELSAGNRIVQVGHSFPAPPIGAYFILEKPVTTHPRTTGGGVRFREINGSLYAAEFSDASRRYFLLEPPLPPPPYPDMDAIRLAHNPPWTPPPPPTYPMAERFEKSLAIDYDKWKEGIGYDVDAIREANADERRMIEDILLYREIAGWREVEALAVLDTPAARKRLKKAAREGSNEVRLAVARKAPMLVSQRERIAALVHAFGTGEIFSGLSEALAEAAEFHPPAVKDAIFRGALHREGGAAVHLAALLMFLHGKAKVPFDWDHRPFFLKFHAPPGPEREALFRELCEKIGVDPARYLR